MKNLVVIALLFVNVLANAQWTKVNKYDGFGDLDGFYIANKFDGTSGFNSSTSSLKKGAIQMELELHTLAQSFSTVFWVRIKFYVNGELLKEIPANMETSITIRDENGDKNYTRLKVSEDKDYMIIDGNNDFSEHDLLKVMKDNSFIKILLGNNASGESTFLFNIECSSIHKYLL